MMQFVRQYGPPAIIIFALFGSFFGYQALKDLLKQRKVKKAAAEADENTDIWNAFPGPIHWSGQCTCGWACTMGKTTTSFFLAKNEESAKLKILSYHQAQISAGTGVPHHPTADDITVYPVNAPF